MPNQTIKNLYEKFESIKEDVNSGKLPLFAKFDAEKLMHVVKEIRAEYAFLKANRDCVESCNVLIKQLNQYLDDLDSLIENNITNI